MNEWTHLSALSFAVSLLLGCAATRSQPPITQDKLIRSDSIEVPIEGIHVGVHQQGMQVQLVVSHLCDIKREDLLERTTTSGSDVSREEVAEYRGIVRHAVPCSDKPASD